ncbi:protein canopy homolog 4 [Eupeodes corollae]|uniref:protein canopy homolog 4 n=1 Tax=Eupeodes corollae TaxID=290404 RepID=UPI002490E1CB|nr:protein canopy homolog 4 [Eupeodes corollae]
MFLKIFIVFGLASIVLSGPEEDEGVKFASKCETCKILATELQDRLTETGKSHDVLELGYSLDEVKPKKRTEYRRSELRLVESIENVCDRILEYNLHKERQDSTRFAKGMPQTFKALHGLVDKGVKVDLGIPYELWDRPPIEVTQMKTQCEYLLEKYEDVIEDWYFKHQETKPLLQHLCEEKALPKHDQKCLAEVAAPQNDDDTVEKHSKGDKASKEEL